MLITVHPGLDFAYDILPFIFRYSCQYCPEDFSNQYTSKVQRVFAHTLTERRKSTNQKKAITRAKKLVKQVDKTAARPANPGKRERTTVEAISILNLNVEAAPEYVEDEPRVQEAQSRLQAAQTLLDAAKTPKRITRIGKVQSGMSIKRGCQCYFVAKQLLIDEKLCTIHFHEMRHVKKDRTATHGVEFGGQRASLSGRLSTTTKDWIEASLRSGKSPAQVMADHKAEVLRCA